MSVFQDIEFEWEGKQYTLPSNRIMRVIADVEDVITLHELSDAAEHHRLPLSKLAGAWQRVLAAVGIRIKVEDLYGKMFSHADGQTVATQCVSQLLMLMIPPDAMRKAAEVSQEEGETDEPGKTGSESAQENSPQQSSA